MTYEDELRARVVAEALTWLWTPNAHLGRVKGPRGGCDCATLLVETFKTINLFSAEVREYAPQWFLHRGDELYLDEVNKFFDEVPGPPDRMPKPGDLVIYKIGRVYAHGAVVVNWPEIVHLNPMAGYVSKDNGHSSPFFNRRDRKFFRVKGWS